MNLIERQRIVPNVLMLLFTVFLLSINKQYLLLALLPAVACFLLVRKLKPGKPFVIYAAVYVGGFLLIYAVALMADKSIARTLSLKQRDFIALARGGVFLQNGSQFVRIDPDKKEFLDTIAPKTFHVRPGSSYMYWKNDNLEDTLYVSNSRDSTTYRLVWDIPKAGSAVEVPVLKPTLWSLLSYAPEAIYISLCKPGLFSAKTMLERISAIENSLVLLFLLLCIVFSSPDMNKNIFWFCYFVTLAVLLLIGYTTPIAGAIVRYKVPVLPFLLLCGIVALDPKRAKIFADKTKT